MRHSAAVVIPFIAAASLLLGGCDLLGPDASVHFGEERLYIHQIAGCVVVEEMTCSGSVLFRPDGTAVFAAPYSDILTSATYYRVRGTLRLFPEHSSGRTFLERSAELLVDEHGNRWRLAHVSGG